MQDDSNNNEFDFESVIEKLVYFPVGLAAAVAKAAPGAAKTGKNLVEGQLKTAEFLGRMSVDYAKKRYQDPETLIKDVGQMVAKSVGGPFGGLIGHLIESNVSSKKPEEYTNVREADVAHTQSSGEDSSEVGASDADSVGGIAHYETLTANQVIVELAKCTPSQLADVESFELEHRRRRTVLAKLSQYRDASVDQGL